MTQKQRNANQLLNSREEVILEEFIILESNGKFNGTIKNKNTRELFSLVYSSTLLVLLVIKLLYVARMD